VRISDVQGNEYQNNLGNTAAALASAQKAVAAADNLLTIDHTLPVLDSAASAFSTHGSLLYSTGDLPAADRAYQRALTLRRQIAGQSPDDIQNQIALSTILCHLGDLYGGYGWQNLGRTPESLAYYDQAKTVVTALSHKHPDDVDVTKERYKTLLSLSSSEGAVGKQEEAARDLADALSQIEKVSIAEPHDTNVGYELAFGESRLGQMLIDDRQAPAAATHLSRSIDLIEKLLANDAGNANFRRAQSVVEAQYAAALRGAGQVAEAVAHNQKALELARSLSHDAPKSTQYRIDIGISERKLSEGLLAANDPAAALHHALLAEQILCQDEASAKNANTLANCGRTQLAIGKAHLASHNLTAADAALRKAQTIASAQSQADPLNAVFRSDAARSNAALAEALAQGGDTVSARASYKEALDNWSILRQKSSISAEDAHRSEEAALALSALPPPRS